MSERNPYIFAGLGQPKCQLYFDLQAMIAENGGRLRLAEILDSELTKTVWQRNKKIKHIKHYLKWEDELVMSNKPIKEIAQALGRSYISVNQRRYKIRNKKLFGMK